MKKSGLALAWIVLSWFFVVSSDASGAPDAGGFWRGTIQAPGHPLEVMIEIEREDGSWDAAVYVPAQGIRDVSMTDVAIVDRSVAFRIPQVPGDPIFKGTLAEDGATISGTFSQAGTTLAFKLSRSEKPQEATADVYAEFLAAGASGKDLPGTWRGLIESGPHRMRLVLKVVKADDGKLIGALDSLDQGANDMLVDAFQIEEDSVRFQMGGISAEFAGRLNPDGSEIAGLWKQGGAEIPLTFRRKAR